MNTEQVRNKVKGNINEASRQLQAGELTTSPKAAIRQTYYAKSQAESLLAIARILAYATGLDKDE